MLRHRTKWDEINDSNNNNIINNKANNKFYIKDTYSVRFANDVKDEHTRQNDEAIDCLNANTTDSKVLFKSSLNNAAAATTSYSNINNNYNQRNNFVKYDRPQIYMSKKNENITYEHFLHAKMNVADSNLKTTGTGNVNSGSNNNSGNQLQDGFIQKLDRSTNNFLNRNAKELRLDVIYLNLSLF